LVMRAKLVKENIGDIDNLFKPKSEDDIIRDLSNLTQKEKDKKLINASMYGKQEVVKLLIEVGADINAKDSDGDTVLMYASQKDYYINVVKLLIKAGADVNAKNNFEETALMWASKNDNKEIVKLLIEAGADVNAKNKFKNTALMLASINNHLNIVKLLIKAGANINNKNKY